MGFASLYGAKEVAWSSVSVDCIMNPQLEIVIANSNSDTLSGK
jgi:hypothetical protein